MLRKCQQYFQIYLVSFHYLFLIFATIFYDLSLLLLYYYTVILPFLLLLSSLLLVLLLFFLLLLLLLLLAPPPLLCLAFLLQRYFFSAYNFLASLCTFPFSFSFSRRTKPFIAVTEGEQRRECRKTSVGLYVCSHGPNYNYFFTKL